MAEGTTNTAPSSEVNTAEINEKAEMSVDPAMERFLQRSRSEIMYELRRLQHGDRPVTGQPNRESIEHFMSKRLQMRPGSGEGKQNVPANVDSVEEHRPEAVVVEVQGLFEQQRVSSVLQSNNFRRRLENIIRSSISSATRTPPLRSRQSTPAAVDEPPAFNVTLRNRTPSQETVSSSHSSSSASSELSSREVSPQAEGVQNTVSQEPPLAVREERNQNSENVLRPALTWQEISQVHHEEIVQELSELLHRQLVSSTLEGEFRGRLEVQMQNRLEATEANGEQVADFIRSLPPSQHIRNDFSHLGLQPPVENWDNISVTSISATAVPYTQSNLHLSREIQSLKAQLTEMKTMMKLSFDLQMDIQRAIRQEVAAALSHALGPEGASAGLATARSRPVDDTRCLICLDRSSDSVLYQCGHMCLCFTCGKDLMTRGAKCPVCRAPIRDIIRAFKTNQD